MQCAEYCEKLDIAFMLNTPIVRKKRCVKIIVAVAQLSYSLGPSNKDLRTGEIRIQQWVLGWSPIIESKEHNLGVGFWRSQSEGSGHGCRISHQCEAGGRWTPTPTPKWLEICRTVKTGGWALPKPHISHSQSQETSPTTHVQKGSLEVKGEWC